MMASISQSACGMRYRVMCLQSISSCSVLTSDLASTSRSRCSVKVATDSKTLDTVFLLDSGAAKFDMVWSLATEWVEILARLML